MRSFMNLWSLDMKSTSIRRFKAGVEKSLLTCDKCEREVLLRSRTRRPLGLAVSPGFPFRRGRMSSDASEDSDSESVGFFRFFLGRPCSLGAAEKGRRDSLLASTERIHKRTHARSKLHHTTACYLWRDHTIHFVFYNYIHGIHDKVKAFQGDTYRDDYIIGRGLLILGSRRRLCRRAFSCVWREPRSRPAPR